jgi:subtilase family serine protease
MSGRRSPRTTAAIAAALVASVALGVAPGLSGASPRPAGAIVPAEPVTGAAFHPAASTPVTVGLDFYVPPRSTTALRAFIAAVATPGSASYHHYLGRGQFAGRFGATAGTLAAIARYLRGHSMRAVSVSADHLFVHASGSIRAVEALMHTTIRTYRYHGRLVYTNVSAGQVPAALAGKVATVVGLSDVPHFHASYVRGASVHRRDTTTCAQMSAGTNATSGPFTIAQLGHVYGYDAFASHGDFGQGQSLAIFELVNYVPQDLQYYQDCVGKQDRITTVNVDGGSFIDPYGEVEADLDIEIPATLAPRASLTVYQGPNSDTGVLDTYQRIAADDSTQVTTTSWGICDRYSHSVDTAESAVFAEMATQGQTVAAAAGDNGASDCLGLDGTTQDPLAGAIGTDDPASQPYVTGVGGTTIADAATIGTNPASEVVWNAQDQGGTGGGVSSTWPEPSYQVGVPGASSLGRTVPDIAIDADPASGYMIYTLAFGWTPIGGTSAGAPMIATLVLLANEYNATQFGFINPLLYNIGVNHPGVNFNDVTLGNNKSYDVPGYSSAHAGFDATTGWGSPIGSSFLGGDV